MSSQAGWNKIAKLITPEEWECRVTGITDLVARPRVAAIVFWDHFSDRPYGKRWSHLDALRKDSEKVDPTVERLTAALISVGYPEDVALVRAGTNGRQIILRNTDGDCNSNPNAKTQRTVGEHGLLCGVCEQAVEDIKTLRLRGVVQIDGKIRDNWPPQNHNGVIGYMGRAEVQELLDWIFGGAFKRELNIVGVYKDFDKIIKKIMNPKVSKPAKHVQKVA